MWLLKMAAEDGQVFFFFFYCKYTASTVQCFVMHLHCRIWKYMFEMYSLNSLGSNYP